MSDNNNDTNNDNKQCEICYRDAKTCSFSEWDSDYNRNYNSNIKCVSCDKHACVDCWYISTEGFCFFCTTPLPKGFPTQKSFIERVMSMSGGEDPLSITELDLYCYDGDEYCKHDMEPLYDTDIDVLSVFTNLTKLNLGKNSITNLDSLRGLTKLVELNLCDNKLVDLKPLSSLVNLEVLDLSFTSTDSKNNRTYLEPISGLTKLRKLRLSGIKNVNTNSLSGLTNLTDLSLNFCEGIKTGPLMSLVNLVKLNMRKCRVRDTTFLTPLTKLVKLDLSGNKVRVFDCVDNFPHLSFLDLSYNTNTNLKSIGIFTF
jgi:hypothetical protein